MKMRMKLDGSERVGLVVGACGLLALVFAGQPGLAQQTAKEMPVTSPAITQSAKLAPAVASSPSAIKPQEPVGEEEGTAKPSKPGGEGIKVHGHWVLQVKNADGTLGERREFENSLVTNTYGQGGDQLLIGLLTGEATPGGFMIGMVTVNTSANPDPASWCSDSGSVGTCYMLTQANNVYFGLSKVNRQNGLTTSTPVVTPNGNGAPIRQIVLAGNFTIPSGLTVLNAVATYQATCFPPVVGLNTADIPSTQCVYPVPSQDGTGFSTFTATVIGGSTPAPLTNLIAGQIIQVSVTLSFS
jgi:hypothetical protein